MFSTATMSSNCHISNRTQLQCGCRQKCGNRGRFAREYIFLLYARRFRGSIRQNILSVKTCSNLQLVHGRINANHGEEPVGTTTTTGEV